MQTILARLQEGNHSPVEISGCSSASAALLLARLLEVEKRSICCLLPSEEEMQILVQDFSFFSSAVKAFTSKSFKPFDQKSWARPLNA